MSAGSERRQFLTHAVQGVAAAACGGVAWNALLVQQVHAVPFALRPPGAQAERDFAATCVKCGACVVACPYGTLRLATAATGIPLGTPHFVARDEPCRLCPDIPCAKACPTGSLDRALRDIYQARMGLAVIDAENCLSWNGLRCEVCYRVCPVQGKAITITPHPRETSKHAVFVPVIHSEACTGCGLCERACPTTVAAIRIVQPSLVQGRIGEHFRMEWKPEARQEPAQAPAAPPPAPARPAPAEPAKAPGLDYFNAGAKP
jgi:ferredoxin-type protein NapG